MTSVQRGRKRLVFVIISRNGSLIAWENSDINRDSFANMMMKRAAYTADWKSDPALTGIVFVT